jgi:hypothetical protein
MRKSIALKSLQLGFFLIFRESWLYYKGSYFFTLLTPIISASQTPISGISQTFYEYYKNLYE